jgi:hypothetical protein
MLLLIGSSAGDVAFCDFAQFVRLSLHSHDGTVTSLCFAGAGGKFGVSASEDTTIAVWEFATGRAVRTIAGHSARRLKCLTALKGHGAAVTAVACLMLPMDAAPAKLASRHAAAAREEGHYGRPRRRGGGRGSRRRRRRRAHPAGGRAARRRRRRVRGDDRRDARVPASAWMM